MRPTPCSVMTTVWRLPTFPQPIPMRRSLRQMRGPSRKRTVRSSTPMGLYVARSGTQARRSPATRPLSHLSSTAWASGVRGGSADWPAPMRIKPVAAIVKRRMLSPPLPGTVMAVSRRLATRSGARPRVRNEIAEHAAADGEVVGEVDHLADVPAAQLGAAELLRHQRVGTAEVAAPALHMIDVDPVAALAEGDGLLVDHHHVVLGVGREAADRRSGDLAGKQLVVALLGLGGADRLLGRGGCAADDGRADQQESDAAHSNLQRFLSARCFGASFHERKLSLASLKRANSSTLVARTNGLVSRSSATVVGSVIVPASRSAATPASRSAIAGLSGSASAAKRAFASVYSCPQ